MSADFQGPDFQNWPVSIDYRPRKVYQPSSITDLANFVNTAAQNDRRVRGIGSAWSLSDAELSNDYLISGNGETGKWFSRVLAMSQGSNVWGVANVAGDESPPISPVLVAALTPDTIAAGKKLVHAEAGITLVDLYMILDSPGRMSSRGRWALPDGRLRWPDPCRRDLHKRPWCRL